MTKKIAYHAYAMQPQQYCAFDFTLAGALKSAARRVKLLEDEGYTEFHLSLEHATLAEPEYTVNVFASK